MKTKDGKSRRFCFIGFKSDDSAEDVVQYFNDSYLDSSKIQVEVAKSFSDGSLVSSKEKKRRAYEAELEREIKRQKKLEEEKNQRKRQRRDCLMMRPTRP